MVVKGKSKQPKIEQEVEDAGEGFTIVWYVVVSPEGKKVLWTDDLKQAQAKYQELRAA